MKLKRKIQNIVASCKSETLDTYNFCKSHPLGFSVLLLSGLIFVYAPGNWLLITGTSVGLLSVAVQVINFEERSRLKKIVSNRCEQFSQENCDRYELISIQLHPQVIVWAKKQAEKQGVEYQTIINDALLKIAL